MLLNSTIVFPQLPCLFLSRDLHLLPDMMLIVGFNGLYVVPP